MELILNSILDTFLNIGSFYTMLFIYY